MVPSEQARVGRRPGRGWQRVSYGLYRPGSDTPKTGSPEVDADLAAWQLLLPRDGCFTALTAATSYGWWLPARLPHVPIFVGVPRESSRLRRRGLRVTRYTKALPVQDVGGIRMSTPASTLLACGRDLEVLDLVVLCDSALHLEACTREDIAREAAGSRRGAPALRRALALADGRSESAWESLLRVLHVTCSISVVPQRVVRDKHGAFVARGDLWLVGTRSLHEYDGAAHRDRSQHRRDLARDRRIQDAGWTRRGYTSREVVSQAATIIREADAALGRPYRPDRVRRWHALLADSMVTPSGRERLRLRWSRPPA